MISRALFVICAGLILAIAIPSAAHATAQPQQQPQEERLRTTCPDFGKPNVDIVQAKGVLRQNQEKTAFDIAREKSVKYNVKMPLRQGNLGRAIFRVQTDVELVNYPSMGCIVIKRINSRVIVDHEIEIAAEHIPGSCMYNEFYNLEMEMMQQDEAIINNELQKARQLLRAHFSHHNTYGPISGIDLDQARFEKEREIRDVIQGMVDKIAEKIVGIRQESDLPEFYEEIRADCSGG